MPDTVQLDPTLAAAKFLVAEISVIDVDPLLHGTKAERAEVARKIGDACRNIGFFYITGHGVPENLIAETFAASKRFFSLPAAVKAEVAIENSACHRGYFSTGGENLDPAKQKTGDLKEALGREMLHACAMSLDLPETWFDGWLTAPMTTLGPLHYPPQTGRITEAQIGAGAHTDYGCLTLLAQDDAGGLHVRNAAGQWVDAPPIPGSFVVNIGDMMERWTNGVFTSTLHRVINISGRERYSLPFFFDPDFYTPVACLEPCLGDGAKFPPTTAGQHLLDKINASFSYHNARAV
jgi:isopenicillin N synthase-like dioxygenase